MVRRITERGSRGYQAEETTVQPSVDYAAAAEAAVRADPVVLPPSAQEELAGITGQVADEAQRFAAAQREIFERGRQRELEAGQRYFDQGALVREATDFALARYSEQLAEDERRRQEAARRAASAFQSFSPAPTGDSGTRTPGALELASPELQGPRRIVRQPDPDLVDDAYENFFARLPEDQIDDANLLTQAYDGIFDEGMTAAQAYFALGKSEAETRKLLAEGMDAAGMATYDANRMAGYIVTAYAPLWEGDFSDNPLDPFRFDPAGIEERTRVPDGYIAPNTPRPSTYLTSVLRSEPAGGRDYTAPVTGQAASTQRPATYSTTPRRNPATRPTTRARPDMAGAPYASAAFEDTAYGELLAKYGIG